MSTETELSRADRTALLAVITDLRDANAELQGDIAVLRDANVGLQATIVELQGTNGEHQAVIAQQTATIAELQGTNGEHQTVITQQAATIEELKEEIEVLKRRLPPHGKPIGMPGNKIVTRPPRVRKSGPRKKRKHGYGRKRMEPTRRVEHVLDHCPECGTAMAGGWKQRTREVIDIPPTPVEVTEHVFIARMCAKCRKPRAPKGDLRGEVIGRQRLGINLLSLIVTLKEEARMTVGAIQLYLLVVHHLKLSEGAITNAAHLVAEHGRQTVEENLKSIRGSPVVHADETGYRENGANGYVWTFSTPTARYFVRRGRKGEVVDEALGKKFGGVLVSDFYAGYHHYDALKQKCWAHLLGDVHELKRLHPDDKELARWAKAVYRIYVRAKKCAPSEAAPPKGFHRLVSENQRKFEKQLLAVCRPYMNDETAKQAKLCRRVERHIKELFVFTSIPDVPSDNNAAERSLRHLVISRKISGGTRSPKGTETKMTLASLYGTWRVRGLNPLDQTRQLLLSHQV